MDVMSLRRGLLLKQNSDEIAFGYRKIDYIQSVPYIYIDTGVLITTDLELEFELSIAEVTAGRYIMGEYTSNSGTFFLYISSPQRLWQTAYGCLYANTSKVAETGRHLFRYLIENNTALVYCDNDLILSKEIAELPLKTITICGSNRGAGTVIPCNTYSFQMKKAGSAIRNFLPCVRVADGKAGMYDTVTKAFYTSATANEFVIPS